MQGNNKTAQDFAAAASSYSQAADNMKPDQADDYAHAQSLIVYHLRAAATKSREIAEHIASRQEKGTTA